MFDDLLDTYLDDTHRAFRDVCLRFAREQIAPFAFQWEEAGAFDRDLYRSAGEAGLLAPHFPAAWGGGGGDVFHAVVAGEALLRGGSTGTVVGLGSLQIALPPLLLLGTDEQKNRFVPPVLRGELISALAITEPDAGSDVAGLKTSARRVGDGWEISGEKRFITSGARADRVMVLCRTSPEPHAGLTFFWVDRGRSGYRVAGTLAKTGWWASDTAELHFDRVWVPDDQRIGSVGSGFTALMEGFVQERLLLAVNGVALAQVALDEALAYAHQRQAFGKPLARFQVLRHRLAEMSARTNAARALVYALADRVRRGKPSWAEAAQAKNVAAEAAVSVTSDAVQIFGGMGYMRETLVERLSRDARLLPIGGGTHEIMNELVARGLGLA